MESTIVSNIYSVILAMVQNVVAVQADPEQELRDKLSQESRFSSMPKNEQDIYIKAKLTPTENSDVSKKLVFESQLNEAKNQYENAKSNKATQQKILNDHIKNLVDRGEPIVSMKPLDIIEQSVKWKVYSPEKRRDELKPKSETQLVDALKAQLDDKNNTISVDNKLSEYYSLNEGEVKIRFKNIRTRRRAKKWTELLNTQKPEHIVLHLVTKGSLFTRKSLLRDPNRVNDQLNKQYVKYIKPDIDALKAWNADDKKLAQQLQDKLVAVKRSYAISRIEPLLDLKNSNFN